MDHNRTYDKEKVSFNLARLRIQGETLEIVVDPEKAVEYKSALRRREEQEVPEVGEPDFREALRSDEIFHDAHKGQLASQNFLEEVFGTDESINIAAKILRDGELQLTSEQRNKIIDNKRKQIIQIIHRNAMDPTTNMPIPVQRIQNILDNTHHRIDMYKKPENQVDDILHILKPIIPIKFDTKNIIFRIFKEYAPKVYGTLKQYNVIHESWNDDGSLSMRINVPAGMRVDVIDRINSLTHGNVEVEVTDE